MQNVLDNMLKWDINTICIYVASVVLSFLFACIYNRRKNAYSRLPIVWMILSAASIWVVLAFSTCGTDYLSYKRIFGDCLKPSYWAVARVEKGYILLNVLVRLFTEDFRVFHAVWATIFIFLVYKAFYDHRNTIHIGLAVLMFASVYCFQSMNLMRMYLSMAIIMAGSKHYLNRNYKKALTYLVIAFFFHRSSICLVLPLLFSYFFPSKKKFWFKIIATFGILMFFIVFRSLIFTNGWFAYNYDLSDSFHFGISNIVYHLPIACILWYAYDNRRFDQENIRLFTILALASFLFGSFSYIVVMAGRLFVYFSLVFCLLPAYVIEGGEKVIEDKHYFGYPEIIKYLYIAFILFRALMMTEFFYPDGIMPYTNCLF